GAEPGASEPGEYRLGTIVEMHEDPVPGLHAAGVQARGEARDTIPELAIGPRPARSDEGTPDQVGMAGPQAGLRLDETADVLAGERMERCGSDPAHREYRRRSATGEDRLALAHECVRRFLVVLGHRAADVTEGLGIERIRQRA